MSCPPQKDILGNALNTLAKNLHATSHEKGFWPEDEKNFKEELLPLVCGSKVEDSIQAGELCEKIMVLAKKHKAWDQEKMIAQKLLLAVGEISEAYEGLRTGNKPDDHIPSVPSLNAEIADTVIRLLDLCHQTGVDIGEAVKLKSEYNKNRPFLHGKKF